MDSIAFTHKKRKFKLLVLLQLLKDEKLYKVRDEIEQQKNRPEI
jgi:hypothetical protein